MHKELIAAKELQDRLEISSGSMSEILQKMEDANLIVRTKSADDKRQVDLALSEHGQTVAEQVKTQYHQSLMRIFECLSASDRRKLSGLLDALTDELEDRLDYDDDSGRHRGEHHHHDSHHHRAEPPEKKSGEADNITEIRKVI